MKLTDTQIEELGREQLEKILFSEAKDYTEWQELFLRMELVLYSGTWYETPTIFLAYKIRSEGDTLQVADLWQGGDVKMVALKGMVKYLLQCNQAVEFRKSTDN
jgi:hypothetical protein